MVHELNVCVSTIASLVRQVPVSAFPTIESAEVSPGKSKLQTMHDGQMIFDTLSVDRTRLLDTIRNLSVMKDRVENELALLVSQFQVGDIITWNTSKRSQKGRVVKIVVSRFSMGGVEAAFEVARILKDGSEHKESCVVENWQKPTLVTARAVARALATAERVLTPEFNKAVAELHTHDDAIREVLCTPSSLIDIRQTLSDNTIKDMLTEINLRDAPVSEPVDENSLKDLNDPANTVVCHLCGKRVPSKTAHLHQERWIGDECCWDDRLKSSE